MANELYYGDNLDILRGDRLNLPMARADAVKSAKAAGDDDKQAALDL